jgi:23S rRNA (adenine2503-C2)-methyltransferase
VDLAAAHRLLTDAGAPRYRLDQATRAATVELAERWDEVTTLPRALREQLEAAAPLRELTVEDTQRGADGTVKLRLRTADGYPLEAVAMRHRDRRTVCLSSQSGCALACTFCATGAMGFGRNLSAGEIVEQLLVLARLLRNEQDARVHNVVMMGMGEPFQNYERVLDACRSMNDPDGFGLGARQIAISTAGWVPGIDKLAREPMQIKLALSLHAPNDELRAQLMPLNKRFPIADLMAACRRYREQTRRRIFVEYLLLEGVNDGLDTAHELARLLLTSGGRRAFHVNLIAYNPTAAGYHAANDRRVQAFAAVLDRQGVPHSYRISRGRDIDAACGQLAMKGLPPRQRPLAAPV